MDDSPARGAAPVADAVRGVSVDLDARGAVPDATGAAAWAGVPPVCVVDVVQAGAATIAKLYTVAAPAFAFLIDDTGAAAGSLMSGAEVQRRLSSATSVGDLTGVLDSQQQ